MKSLQVTNAPVKVKGNAKVLELAADGDGAKESLSAQTPLLNQLRSSLTLIH